MFKWIWCWWWWDVEQSDIRLSYRFQDTIDDPWRDYGGEG